MSADWEHLGKLFIGVGIAIALLGFVLVLADRVPGIANIFGWFGKLPGDISVKRENFSFYFPLGTSLVLSVLLSLLFYVLSWILRR